MDQCSIEDSNPTSAARDLWADTQLGPQSAWPPCLRLTVDIMLNSPLASVLMWGEEQVMVFNQAYAALLGSKQLRAPGGKVPALRPAAWSWNPAALQSAWAGTSCAFSRQTLQIWRDGGLEEPLLDLYYTPIRDEQLSVRGVLCSMAPATPEPPAELQPDSDAGAGLSILVVEDNLDAQYLVCEMLRAFGHRVQAAARGEDAAEMLQAARFDVLFTDVSLPGISGVDLARDARRRQPGLKIIFASGFGDLLTRHLEFPAMSLQKPYDFELLKNALNDIRVQLQGHGM